MKLEMRQKLLLGVTGGLVALVWLFRYLYLPAIATIEARRATLQDLKVKIADAQVLTAQLPDHQAALRDAQERYRALESRLGAGQSVARVLEALSAEAKDHRLELAALKPRTDERERRVFALSPEMLLTEMPLTLQLTGRYRQLGEFLGGLRDAPFVASVQELKITKPEAGHAQLQADLVLAVYLAERAAAPQ